MIKDLQHINPDLITDKDSKIQ